LGLAYLGAVLRKNGHSVEIKDLEVEPEAGKKMDLARYDLVGITSLTPQYPKALEIAKSAKALGLSVVMGGYHATFQDKEVLLTGLVDYVIRGEGEYTLVDLVDRLASKKPVDDVSGISFMDRETLVRTPPAPVISELDGLPLPARDLLPMERYTTMFEGRKATSLITSRGCPFNCSFCASSKFAGRKWRTRSIGSVIDEIEHLRNEYHYNAFTLMDDNFTLSPKRVIDFADQLIKRGLDVIWWCFSRVDTIVKNEHMVKKMAEAGARSVFLGIESSDQEILDGYHKRITIDQIYRARDILRSYKIKTWGSFIIGGIDETKRMINRTIRLARRLNPDTAQFSILTPYPGTELFKAVKDRIVVRNWDLYDGIHAVMKTRHLSPQEIQKSIIKAYTSFYLRLTRLPQVFSYIMKKNLKLRDVIKGVGSVRKVSNYLGF